MVFVDLFGKWNSTIAVHGFRAQLVHQNQFVRVIEIIGSNTVQSVHSKRFIRLLSSIIILAAALDSVTFRGFVYGICTTDA